jgi:FtsP/CotA-like multicopper oxidase with cupredoxin domain
MQRIPVGLSVLAFAVICACGGTPAQAGGNRVAVVESDAGKTITVRSGDTIRITLEDTYPVPGSSLVWNVGSSATSVLQPGATTRSKQVSSGPGRTDTYTADFLAAGAGQALLDSKGTTTCEAMAKPNCPDRQFTITVVVTR